MAKRRRTSSEPEIIQTLSEPVILPMEVTMSGEPETPPALPVVEGGPNTQINREGNEITRIENHFTSTMTQKNTIGLDKLVADHKILREKEIWDTADEARSLEIETQLRGLIA